MVKKNTIIILSLILAVLAILIIFTSQKAVNRVVDQGESRTDYCDQFSGFHSYAWGGDSKKCTQAGCAVKKIQEVGMMNDIQDDEGYTFKCVPK